MPVFAPRAPASNPLLGGTVFGSPSPSAASSLASGTGVVPSGWDAAELSRIERALANHVGPMARLMVRDAARSCSDSTSLALAVSRHIAEDAKRQQFLHVAHAGSQARPVGSGVGPATGGTGGTGQTPVPPPQGAAIADPLTDEFKAHSLQVMTRRMGPIMSMHIARSRSLSVLT